MWLDKVGTKVVQKASKYAGKIRNQFPRIKASAPDTFTKCADDITPAKLQKIFANKEYMLESEKTFWKDLHALGTEKFDFITKHKYFGESCPFFNDTSFVKAVKKMNQKELEQTFNEIEELYKTLPQVAYNYNPVTKELIYSQQTPNHINLAQLTTLKSNNKEAYEYILKNPDKERISSLLENFENHVNGTTFETLTIPQIKQMDRTGITSTLSHKTDLGTIVDGNAAMSHYVESSDLFAQNADNVAKLNKYLSRNIVAAPFTAFRAERDTGMFDVIPLDKKLALKTKWLVMKNMGKAKNVNVHGYTGQYETTFTEKTNLLKYIMKKDKLTLADAMQVAKYGDEAYRKQIIEMIKNSQIKDSRFKSLTFDSGMAAGWIPTQGSKNTGILHNMTVQQGTQGAYSHVDNRQVEFILNNNPKNISFQDVVYNAEKDIFEVNSTVSLF